MKIRNIPFGWKYENGKKVLDEKEADVLRNMYRDYLQGNSLAASVRLLELLKIEYQEGKTGWNKSRVRRLLSDKRYLGTEEYSPIIDRKTFEAVQKKLKEANQQGAANRKDAIYQIHNVHCDRCGAIMKRRPSYSGKRHERWVCQNDSCHLIAAKPDAELIEDLRVQLNTLIQEPQKIRYEKKEPAEKKKQPAKARALVLREDTEDQYRKLTAQIAEAYSRLDTNEYLTQRLRDEFNRQEPLSVFSWELYAHAVKEVRMQADGTISIILKNEQRIGGGEDAEYADSQPDSE